jgi:hypothetical protein
MPAQPVDPVLPIPDTDVAPPDFNQPDPGSQECRDLWQKMENIRKDISKREQEVARNQMNLPERIGPGERLRDTIRGHRKIIRKQERNLRELEKKYEQKCGKIC